jgi:hypothetical protein
VEKKKKTEVEAMKTSYMQPSTLLVTLFVSLFNFSIYIIFFMYPDVAYTSRYIAFAMYDL